MEDANGIALAYIYFEDDPTRRGLVKRLSAEDAKCVAQTIARQLTKAVALGESHSAEGAP
ncbi:hypothetical protein [Methylocystis sp. B8]|uniref:hypothetical protein n=1 Tax=Methylocystis sp. B8 TaxID=544938 RepID=UPI0010FD248F|nr:hypothetical protein [Methylocystis sp. B8]TLG77806.1 hypothetical protein FEV16_08275 [Methylocystis sp. B8]